METDEGADGKKSEAYACEGDYNSNHFGESQHVPLLLRIELYIQEGTPNDWDGTYVLEYK